MQRWLASSDSAWKEKTHDSAIRLCTQCVVPHTRFPLPHKWVPVFIVCFWARMTRRCEMHMCLKWFILRLHIHIHLRSLARNDMFLDVLCKAAQTCEICFVLSRKARSTTYIQAVHRKTSQYKSAKKLIKNTQQKYHNYYIFCRLNNMCFIEDIQNMSR